MPAEPPQVRIPPPLRPQPLTSALVDAMTPAHLEVAQAQSWLRVGTVNVTSPLRVTLVGTGMDAIYSAEKLTTYTAVVADTVLCAVIGQRVIVLGKVG